jgi:hypothetical protein
MNTQREPVVILATQPEDLTIMLEASIKHEQYMKESNEVISLLREQLASSIEESNCKSRIIELTESQINDLKVLLDKQIEATTAALKLAEFRNNRSKIILTNMQVLIEGYESLHNSDESFLLNHPNLLLDVLSSTTFFVRLVEYDGRFDKFLDQMCDLKTRMPF